MDPKRLDLFQRYDRPAIAADGRVFAALSTPNVADDRYDGVLHVMRPGADPSPFTVGPKDAAPVMAPHGELLVFLRAGVEGPPQLHAMPTTGGEPVKLTDHPLGASPASFSPDGRFITYLAAVPEPGRYGTAESDDETAIRQPDAEAPRLITSLAYRLDGKGFVGDKREQVFVRELVDAHGAVIRDAEPRQLTAETVPVGRPVFTADGAAVIYTRSAAVDSQQSTIAMISVDRDAPAVGETIVSPAGDASFPVVSGDQLYYVGAAFDGNDFAGRCPGLWSVPLSGGEPRRLTAAESVHVEGSACEPIVVGDRVIIAVADRGAVSLRSVPCDADDLSLDELPTVLGGENVVLSASARGGTIAAVVADPGSCGDVVIAAADDVEHGGGGGWTKLSDVSAGLREAGIGECIELNGTAPDGYPVHGWLILPPTGAGPHPVLLDVHGGPHAAYGWGLFDEAQMYATNGYAVVLPNPRGSSGYGQAHGRAIVGALGTVDADDVLALLDVALARADLDADRVGVMGGSYGGFMTSWLASAAPDRFVAGISERAVNAWDSFTGASDIGYFFADAYVGSDGAVQRDRSPLYHADGIAIPLLIIHSEHDWRCPVEQAQRLYVALKSRGAEAEMLLFPGEGHELSRSGRPRHRRERFEAILEWWSRYLPVS